jgi:hypothetical protein
MKRFYILLFAGIALAVILLVKNDTSSLPEKVFENHASPTPKPQKDQSRIESSIPTSKEDSILNSPPSNTSKFKNGSLELSLEFEDSSISAAEASRISEDLNDVFSHLDAKLIKVGDQERLVFEGKGRNWPDILDTLRMPREADGSRSLFIPLEVSDAYRQAFDFIEQHKIEESEVSALLAELESGGSNTESLAVLSPGVVPVNELEGVLEKLARGRIKSPSVLAYRILDVNNSRAVFAETLFLEFNNDSVTYTQVVGVIRLMNKWKIAF